MNTEAKILDKALELFNERGIEYVGLRELAAVLGIRVSNITYYFPTKDDLVYRLFMELNQLNTATVSTSDNLSIKLFLEMLYKIYRNQVKYRCLLLSFVHLMKQNKVMSVKYKETQAIRNATLRSNIEVLDRSGYMKITEDETEFLVSALALINRFWISEAAISNLHPGTEEQIRHYLSMIAQLLLPYSTVKAKKEIQLFFKTLALAVK